MPDDLLTTPPIVRHYASSLIAQDQYGLSPDSPVHKSHIKAWFACPRAFELRMIHGFGPASQPHFATGKLYHEVMHQCCSASWRTRSKPSPYMAALDALPTADKINLNTGSLNHAALLASYYRDYAEQHPGRSEVYFCQKIGPYWFAGSWDWLSNQRAELIDWKTSTIPTRHEADNGPESVIYRLAYEKEYGTLPTLIYKRLSVLWAKGRQKHQPAEIRVEGPINQQAIQNIYQAIEEISKISLKLARISADCRKCPVSKLCMKPNNLLQSPKE